MFINYIAKIVLLFELSKQKHPYFYKIALNNANAIKNNRLLCSRITDGSNLIN
nr:MAG TPA: hypothetical protein [Caudoviricetes sp.]